MHIISVVVSYLVVHIQQLVILVVEAQSKAIQIQLRIERWKSLMMVKVLFLLLLLPDRACHPWRFHCCYAIFVVVAIDSLVHDTSAQLTRGASCHREDLLGPDQTHG